MIGLEEMGEAKPIKLTTLAAMYLTLRRAHPKAPARKVFAYLTSDADCTFEQFVCRHDWAEDDTGRSYCLNGCG